MIDKLKFDEDLLFLVHEVAQLMRRHADRRARLHGMTRAQWALLSRLERQPGISQNELAHIIDVEPITVGRLVDRLQEGGFVQRSPDPADRRVETLATLAGGLKELRANLSTQKARPRKAAV